MKFEKIALIGAGILAALSLSACGNLKKPKAPRQSMQSSKPKKQQQQQDMQTNKKPLSVAALRTEIQQLQTKNSGSITRVSYDTSQQEVAIYLKPQIKNGIIRCIHDADKAKKKAGNFKNPASMASKQNRAAMNNNEKLTNRLSSEIEAIANKNEDKYDVQGSNNISGFHYAGLPDNYNHGINKDLFTD